MRYLILRRFEGLERWFTQHLSPNNDTLLTTVISQSVKFNILKFMLFRSVFYRRSSKLTELHTANLFWHNYASVSTNLPCCANFWQIIIPKCSDTILTHYLWWVSIWWLINELSMSSLFIVSLVKMIFYDFRNQQSGAGWSLICDP